MALVKNNPFKPRRTKSKHSRLQVSAGFEHTIFHDVLENMGLDADSSMWDLAQEIAKDIKAATPVRPGVAKLGRRKKGAKVSKAKRDRPGSLKRSVKASRRGKRYRQEGRWKFFTTRMVVRMRYYGFYVDRGWDHKRAKRWIEGTQFATRLINQRLMRD